VTAAIDRQLCTFPTGLERAKLAPWGPGSWRGVARKAAP
jgi:hypothetical protein